MSTTAFCYSAKQELAMGAHCFAAIVSGLTTTGVSTTHITSISGAGISGIAVGMAVTGTQVAAGSVVALLVSQTALDLSVATTGTSSALVFTGDVFNMALIKSGSYSGTQTNYGSGAGTPSVTNLGTDEVANGSGYTTGGFALTNISPAIGSTAGFWSFTTNPTWTSATFSTTGAMIYNASTKPRLGAPANGITANISGSAVNRSISVHDFGGTETVTSGNFTVLIPTNAQGTALLQIS